MRFLAVGNEVAQFRLVEGMTIEEAERADGLVVEAPGDIFPEEAELVRADVFGAELGRRAAEMTGCRATLNSVTDGGSASAGSSERVSSTWARTSSSAFCFWKLTSNSRIRTATPL